jgi:hypothetical protein
MKSGVLILLLAAAATAALGCPQRLIGFETCCDAAKNGKRSLGNSESGGMPVGEAAGGRERARCIETVLAGLERSPR